MSKRVRDNGGGRIASARHKSGARPKRMKGYHRAVKRGDAWAVRIHSMPEGLGKFFALTYRGLVDEVLLCDLPSPFAGISASEANWQTRAYHQSIILPTLYEELSPSQDRVDSTNKQNLIALCVSKAYHGLKELLKCVRRSKS